MDEQRVRDRLDKLAADMPPIGSVPDGLIRRARLRSIVVPALATVALVAVAVLAFAGFRELVRADTGLPAAPPTPTAPVAPAADRITMVLGRASGRPSDVVAFDPDGGLADQLATVGLERGSSPLDRSADGRLAFTSIQGGGVSVLEPDGEVVPVVPSGTVYGASWSPDGTRLVYAVGVFGDTTIHVVGADGSDDVVLVASDRPEWNAEPSWSPDGSTIAFLRGEADFHGCDAVCRFVGDRRLGLWAVDADGSDVRAIAPGLHARGYHTPSWSPDSSRIAVAAYTPNDHIAVFVVNVASGRADQLTRLGGGAPVWSPEGDRLAFVAQRLDRYQLFLVNADGSGERELATPAVWPASVLIWDRSSLG